MASSAHKEGVKNPPDYWPAVSKPPSHSQVPAFDDVLDSAHTSFSTLTEMFERQVAMTPDSVAVVWQDEHMTYRKLNLVANRLSHTLTTCGISHSSQQVVAVCLERSVELILALVAVLKCGAAYVPIDPDYPPARQQLMVQDSGAQIILTARSHDHFKGLSAQELNIVSFYKWIKPRTSPTPRPGATSLPSDKLPQNVSPESASEIEDDKNPSFFHVAAASPHSPLSLSALYVIYTSGSTGKPKGVVGTHLNTLNRFRWMWKSFPFKTTDVTLCKTSICFVDSVWEIFGSLLHGVKLVMAPQSVVKSTMDLLNVIQREFISRLVLVPTLLQVLLETPKSASKLASLQYCITSGEAIQPALLQRFENLVGLKTSAGITLINLYGSSEVAGDATVFNCSANLAATSATVPIGVGIDHIQPLLLNDRLDAVSGDAIGELYVSGIGMAQGYLNRPGLTAERFLPNPYWTPSKAGDFDSSTTRMYRTGDLVRVDLAGPTAENIIYVGRSDAQVKIRGVRIELGEIEAALSALPGVRECAVVARTVSGSEHKQLVAYYTEQLHKPGSLLPKDVKRSLTATLPSFMVPSHVVLLPEFPLLPNGKLDRLSLPTDFSTRGDSATTTDEDDDDFMDVSGDASVPLASAEIAKTAKALASIWKSVLQLDVRFDDNFFELGGDSIMSIQVVSMAYELGIPLTTQLLLSQPTIKQLASSIVSSSSHKQVEYGTLSKGALIPPEDLENLHLQKTSSKISIMADEEVEDAYPLTPLQSAMFSHLLLHPHSGDYVIQLQWSIRSPSFEPLRLKQAWTRLAQRHAIFRTSFVWKDLSAPLQVVRRNANIIWTDLDWTRDSTEEQAAKLAKLLSEDQRTGFEPDAPTLQHFHLIRTSDTAYEFVWTHHHLYLDGWSMALAIDEVKQLYLQGESASLPPPQSFASFLRWSSQHLQTDRIAMENYWRKVLHGFTSPTPLPRAINAVADVRSAESKLTLSLSAEEMTLMTSFVKQQHVTPHTLLSAAWALLLSLYSREEDIVFGTVFSGRSSPPLPRISSIVGVTINTVPARIKVSRSTKVHVWLRAIAKAQFEAQQYEHAPLALVQSLSELPKGTRLFETLLVLENIPTRQEESSLSSPYGSSDLSGLGVHKSAIFEKTNFPLTLVGQYVQSRLEFMLLSKLDRVSSMDASLLLAQFRSLLVSLIKSSAQTDLNNLPLSLTPLSLDVGTSSMERFLIEECNNTTVSFDTEHGIHELFEQKVRESPDAVLYVSEDDQVTFREANERANRLAHYLVELGVRPEDRVALLQERGLAFVVSKLAVLKAGCCYVPLDPSLPDTRLFNMIEDSSSVLVIVDALYDSVQRLTPPILFVSRSWSFVSSKASSSPSVVVHPRNAAYMIFTSGSTGRPKGVVVEHQALINQVSWYNSLLSSHFQLPQSSSRFLQKSSLSFDASDLELWPPALSGGTCVILPQCYDKDPYAQAALLLHQCITVAFFVPTLLSLAIQGAPEVLAQCDKLEFIGVGGEALPPKLATAILSLFPKCALVNMYGPTEHTVTSHSYTLDRNISENSAIPIGRSIANDQCYVLDKNLMLVGPGVPGELFLAGAGLSRGYSGHPGRTAASFVPNPFFAQGQQTSSRMYATGDLVTYSTNGEVHIIGRIDFQVKLRGLRIELGEIESVLLSHPQITHVLVQVLPIEGIPKLVAHIQPSDMSIDLSTGRTLCEQALPAYMVPSYFVLLSSFPVNSSGKIDRAALPMPTPSSDERDVLLPRNAIEANLAKEWEAVLKIPRVSVLDNFFELGGDSIVSIQLASRMNRHGYNLTVKDVFTHKTIAALARLVENDISKVRAATVTHIEGLTPLTPIGKLTQAHIDAIGCDGVTDILPLTSMQQGMLYETLLQRAADDYVTQMTWSLLKKDVDVTLLKSSFEQVILRHEALRSSFVTHGLDIGAVQVFHSDAALDWNMHMLDGKSSLTERDVESQLLSIRSRNFAFEIGSRMHRFDMIEIDPSSWMLVMTYHHIILDGWSTAILIHEVSSIYASQGKTDGLKSAPSLRTLMASKPVDSQASDAYWRKQLDGISSPTSLPHAIPDSEKKRMLDKSTNEFIPVQGLLSVEVTRDLTEFAKRNHATLSNVFQAAWAYMLHVYSREHDVVFGNTISGRSNPVAGVEQAIGLFINSLPLRVHLTSSTPISVLLSVLQTAHLEMSQFESSGLIDIQRVSSIEKGLPLFESLFVYENFPGTDDGSSAKPLLGGADAVRGTISMPLTVAVEPGAETGGLGVAMIFSKDRFIESNMQSLLDQYLSVLEQLPRCKLLGDLTLASPAEKHFLLEECNDNNVKYDMANGIHELFEQQVLKNPDRILYVSEDEQVTFREANDRANRLSRYLVDLGARSDDRIALLQERGLAFVLCKLAVVKAGCCYVPIDPSFPVGRIHNMIADSSSVLVLVDRQYESVSPLASTIPVLAVTGHTWSLVSSKPCANLNVPIHSRNAVNMIFTSGSTGRPKGVIVEHAALINQLQWFISSVSDLAVSRHSPRYLQKANQCFDASGFELWPALLNGGTCVLLPSALEKDPIAMAGSLLRYSISVCQLVPTVLSMLLEASGDVLAHCESLEYVYTGGEVLNPKSAFTLQSLRPSCVLVNMYGPTEQTIACNAHQFNRHVDKVSVPIGRAIANNQCFVLDKNLHLVGPGVAGQLYMSGTGLARGYHGRSGLTAASFVPNPFYNPSNQQSSSRMYTTGDLCSYLPNGEVSYVGRIDFQVKLRGLRIELGEIESVLLRHPFVAQVLVHVLTIDASKKLVAHLLTKISNIDIPSVRKLCLDSLPAYMVPSYFVPMLAFPVNNSGKIDRAALPLPTSASDDREIILPRNDLEATLAKEWEAVLRIPRVSVLDNFFELGGDSIVSIQLVSRMNRHGYNFTVKDVFIHKTIAGLAQTVAKAIRRSRSNSGAVSFPKALDAEVAVWRRVLNGIRRLSLRRRTVVQMIPVKAQVAISVPADITALLLGSFCSAFNAKTYDLLIAALAIAFGCQEGRSRVALMTHIAGPAHVDPVLNLFPVSLSDILVPSALQSCIQNGTEMTAASRRQLQSLFQTMKNQFGLSTPNSGLGYGLLRHRHPIYSTLFTEEHAQDEAVASEIVMHMLQHAPATSSSSLVDIHVEHVNGELIYVWKYAPTSLVPGLDVVQWASDCVNALRLFAALVGTAHGFGRTPSDYPLVSMSQSQVDHLVTQAQTLEKGIEDIEDMLPLSPMQQGMLFHSMLNQSGNEYVTFLAWTIKKNDIDMQLFKSSWAKVVERHAALRTSFVVIHVDAPVQVIHRDPLLNWTDLPLPQGVSHLPKPEFDAIIAAERDSTFDFAFASRPFHFRLVELSADEWLFIWTHHHILLDGWSVSIVLNEVMTHYATKGNTVFAPTSSIKPFFTWLRSGERDPKTIEPFWRQQLKGFSTPTPLPNASPEAAEKLENPEPIHLVRDVPADLARTLSAFAKQHSVTLSNLFQAAWAYVLHVYSGEQDVLFGNTVAGRSTPIPGVEHIVSLLINTLPLRVQVAGSSSILALVQALQALHFESAQFEDTPLVDIQRWSSLDHGVVLFNSVFVFENFPEADVPSEGIPTLTLLKSTQRLSVPLTISVSVLGDSHLNVDIQASPNRYSESSVIKLLDQYLHVLSQLAFVSLVGDLTLATPFEKQFLLEEINNINVPVDSQHGIHELFEQQVQANPDRILFVCDDEHLTFREVNARANQLARYMVELGVRTEDRIALLQERGLPYAISYLAIVKAGGCYVPIDPSFPPSRIANMLEDSGAVVVLTDASYEVMPRTVPVICVPSHWAFIAAQPTSNLGTIIHPRNAVYMIFTSGSTGRPKGVVVEHENLIYQCAYCNDFLLPTSAASRSSSVMPSERILQLSNTVFDASCFELWSAPLTGDTLVLLSSAAAAKDPTFIAPLLLHQCITFCFMSPTLLVMLLETSSDLIQQMDNFRHLDNGGEAANSRAMLAFLALLPDCTITNSYGPTEHTITSHIHVFDQHADTVSVPIGRINANNQNFILDKSLQVVGPGVPGELFLAGKCGTRGYHGRPGLTASRFIPNPFHSKNNPSSSLRMYTTGDLVTYRHDGAVQYMGRIDFQVKLRGLRIELGEIESVLLSHPDISQVLVLVLTIDGSQKLVAYIMVPDLVIDLAAVRKHCAETLAPYMVPSHFVPLLSFPLNASGKIDRTQLPAPVVKVAEPAVDDYRKNDLERKLTTIWGSVLHVYNISLDANFFELGGDSILSIQIVSKASQYGLKVTVKDIFRFTTIRELARHLESQVVAADSLLEEHEQGPVTGAVLPTPIIHSFHDEGLKNPHLFIQAELLELHVKLSRASVLHMVEALVKYHDMLRLRVVLGRGTSLPKLTIMPYVADAAAQFVTFVSLPETPSDQKDIILSTNTWAQHSLHLETGPIFRFVHYKRPVGGDLLFLVIHHISVDGVSWRVLASDIHDLADSLSSNTEDETQEMLQLSLPAKTTSFKRWSELLNTHAHNLAADSAELAFWKSMLSRTPSSINNGSPLPKLKDAKVVVEALTESETKILIGPLLSFYRVQINHVLLMCFAASFISGKGSFGFTLEGHGREEIIPGVDLTRTVGWFTTIFPVILTLESELTEDNIEPVLSSVKNQLLAIPFRGIGFGVLRDLVAPSPLFSGAGSIERQRNASVASEVLFNYLGQYATDTFSSDLAGLVGEMIDKNETCQRLVEVNSMVRYGVFAMEWGYTENAITLQDGRTIPQVAARMTTLLRLLIRSYTNSHYAPSPSAIRPTQSTLMKTREYKSTLLLHPVDGTTMGLENLAEGLKLPNPVVPVLTPSELRNIASLEDLASNYVNVLLERDPVGPYLVVGYSFGGPVALEVCRLLGPDVATLVIVDQEVLPDGWTSLSHYPSPSDVIANFVKQVLEASLHGLGLPGLSADELDTVQAATASSKLFLLLALVSYIMTQRNVPHSISTQILNRVEMYHLLTYLFHHYHWPSASVSVAAPIVVIRTLDTTSEPPGLGWGRYGTVVSEQHFSCGHNDILKNPNLAQLIPSLRSALLSQSSSSHEASSSSS